jgi:ABC-type branched-subunit amino acid transport system ATPase component
MLDLDEVSVEIAGAPVLRRVSLHVPAGGRVALLGRNGAGKTTTLRTLMGLLTPRNGRIAVAGADAARLPAHHRARLGIGYAPEDRGLFGRFTVRENMLLPARLLGLTPDELSVRLDRVFALLPELRDLAPRRAAGLSGGQGKMVALGRALIVGTRAVLLDEPFQGLARVLALRYAEALARLRDELPEVAVLITESNPELLRPLVEQTYVIERGEIGLG